MKKVLILNMNHPNVGDAVRIKRRDDRDTAIVVSWADKTNDLVRVDPWLFGQSVYPRSMLIRVPNIGRSSIGASQRGLRFVEKGRHGSYYEVVTPKYIAQIFVTPEGCVEETAGENQDLTPAEIRSAIKFAEQNL